MEYIDGESLEQRLRLGAVPWRTALPWAMQIAAAIEAAHRRGIVHRDLKPANVMLAEIGREAPRLRHRQAAGRIRRRRRWRARADRELHGGTAVVGTLQLHVARAARGAAGSTPRTDVFRLGVTLYEMLTGRKAFDGDEPRQCLGGDSDGGSAAHLRDRVGRVR